jgi:apolipoprotein N-acyltransferase
VTKFLLYIAIGLVLATCIGLVAWYMPKSIGQTVSAGWVGLVIFTPLTFWIVIRQYRFLWRQSTFWLTLIAMLLMHLIGFTILLRSYPGWRLFWYIPTMILEVVLIALVVEKVKLIGRGPNKNDHRNHTEVP